MLVAGCSSGGDDQATPATTAIAPTSTTLGSPTAELPTNESCGLTLSVPSLRSYCGTLGTPMGDGMAFAHPDGLATRYVIDVENVAGQPLLFGALYVGAQNGVVTEDSRGRPQGDIDLYFLARDTGAGPRIVDIIEVAEADDFSTDGSMIYFTDPNRTLVEIVGTNFVYRT